MLLRKRSAWYPSGMFTFVKKKQRFRSWSLLIVVAVFLFVFVGVSTVRQTYNDWKFDQELVAMQKEIAQLEGKKEQLHALLERLDSPESLDKEARTRLGLKKPEERVIVLQGFDNATHTWSDVTIVTSTDSGAKAHSSHVEGWFDYFF